MLDLVAVLVSGKAVLLNAQSSDFYVTGLGALVTIVYLGGLVFSPARQVARMGIDSIMVISLNAIGTFGLIALAGGGS